MGGGKSGFLAGLFGDNGDFLGADPGLPNALLGASALEAQVKAAQANVNYQTLQNQLQAQLAQQQYAFAQLQFPSPPVAPRSHFTERKLNLAIDRLVSELPFRVVGMIVEIKYLYDEHCFHLVFMGGHEMFFNEADAFPTDADVARVCLEAP